MNLLSGQVAHQNSFEVTIVMMYATLECMSIISMLIVVHSTSDAIQSTALETLGIPEASNSSKYVYFKTKVKQVLLGSCVRWAASGPDMTVSRVSYVCVIQGRVSGDRPFPRPFCFQGRGSGLDSSYISQ